MTFGHFEKKFTCNYRNIESSCLTYVISLSQKKNHFYSTNLCKSFTFWHPLLLPLIHHSHPLSTHIHFTHLAQSPFIHTLYAGLQYLTFILTYQHPSQSHDIRWGSSASYSSTHLHMCLESRPTLGSSTYITLIVTYVVYIRHLYTSHLLLAAQTVL